MKTEQKVLQIVRMKSLRLGVAVTITILLVVSYLPYADATTIRVPTDQPTIQAGINAASNGDTVLVDPGVYVENISFNGKGILVGSRFVLSGDTSHISLTVIHGSGSAAVVTFASNEDSASTLVGFTVTGGSRGIYCQNSGPMLRNLIVVNNTGYGGIYCLNSNPIIVYAIIMNNYSQNGGGLFCSSSSPRVTYSTISNNSAQYWGGGVYCSNSSPILTNVAIMRNTAYIDGGGIYCKDNSTPIVQTSTVVGNTAGWYGGGIVCDGSNPLFNNMVVQENEALKYYGGGLYCRNSAPTLTNVLITRNKVHRTVGVASGGGGISCLGNSSPNLSNVTISRNSAKSGGGGIYVDNSSTVTFDAVSRCNIYLNDATVGYDVYSNALLHVVVDTFTVMNPGIEHMHPLANFTFDIFNAKAQQNQSTLYVSMEGDNGNSGLSWEEPLKTIGFAKSIIYATAETSGTIYLGPGTYSYETNGEHFMLYWKSYVTLKGIGVNATILQSDNDAGILNCYLISRATIEDLTMKGGGYGFGGAVRSYNSSLVLKNIRITDCNAEEGGAINSHNSNVTLVNALISNNSASRGGGIYGDSRYDLVNVTITNNTASDDGGGIYSRSPRINLVNSIFWDNVPDQIYQPLPSNVINIAHSNIQNGQGGISGGGTVNWLQGNIDGDPLFVNPASGDFHLMNGSPGIGAGIDTIAIDGSFFFSPREDIEGTSKPSPVGSSPDLGAYENEFGEPTSLSEGPSAIPGELALFQNYPNPFNPSTTIPFRLPSRSFVSLKVFDTLGREVASLFSEELPAGEYSRQWNGANLPAAVYFCRLQVGTYCETRKLMLIK